MKSFKILIQYFCINKYKLTNLITSLGILSHFLKFCHSHTVHLCTI